MEQPQPTQAVSQPEPRKLTPEEMNDLRKRVLLNQPLSVEEARCVIATLRQGSAVAVLAGESKSRKGKSSKASMSDEALDKDLADLGL